MKTRRSIALAGLAIAGVLAGTSGSSAADSHKDRTILEDDTLIGVQPPFTGATHPIRGVPGGGAPWVIADGEIEVKASGKIEMEVEGLVIDPAFPNPAVAGINPAPFFKVIVSCLSKDAGGAVVITNVSTAPIPADRAGNSSFEGTVALPRQCIDPIAFVANGGGNGAWFAVTDL